jgi:hypothetical protein
MPIAVRISDELAKKAKVRAKGLNRTLPGQIEFWARIGRIAEDNPDLPFSFIQNILRAQEEAESGELSPYVFGEGK